MSGFLVVFVTRERCSLCAKAEPLVTEWAEEQGVRLDRVLVDSDPQLLERFTNRVPVVMTPDGQVLAEGRITQSDLAEVSFL